MASTYTSRIGLEKQGDGENANSWGLRLNSNVIDLVDEAVAGYALVTLTSGTPTSITTTDGSSSVGRNSTIELVGVIDANTTVVIPATQKTYFVVNSITGNGTVFMKPSGGSVLTTVVSAGKSMYIATDGSRIRRIGEVEAVTSVANATNAEQIFVNTTAADANYRMVFGPTNDSAGNQPLYKDTVNAFYYNPSSNQLNVGSLVASGNVTAYSDKRLKDNITTLDGTKVFEMRGVSFTKDNVESSGVIAQELEQVAPELVIDDGEYKSVAYGNVVGYLIEAVKYLKQEIEELKSK
jgi:hypothetical protein